MKRCHVLKLLLGFLALFCLSCGEDRESLKTESKLKQEKLELESHLGLVRQEIAGFPAGLDRQIDETRNANSVHEEECSKLQIALEEANEEIRNLKATFEMYRQGRPLPLD
jgi:hypothetical protein